MRPAPHSPQYRAHLAQARRRRRRAVLLTVSGTVVVALFLGWRTGLFVEGSSYPVADPAGTARRLDQRTQEVRDALGLPHAELDTDWPGAGRKVEEDCPYTGLSHFFDQLHDTPPTMPGVVVVSTEWALKGVTAEAGQSALRRARATLAERGWRITTDTSVDRSITLTATPPDGGATLHIATYPYDRLAVSAASECVRASQGSH
ncbi:hypothetical protein ACFY71_21550 [Streptomyces cinerochromogenes]|uniref:hypothetical protein n=1 Tax=Streptomyces cinerochromogenes TaxID=66422 RepID=UPI00369E201C